MGARRLSLGKSAYNSGANGLSSLDSTSNERDAGLARAASCCVSNGDFSSNTFIHFSCHNYSRSRSKLVPPCNHVF
ncbi:hypothetical protein TIFTF001_017586 [Ficus carica]|uniref:Uncharacterized protein n=1 Tax=Ficus carica TaxID=3494 RepID=A0AA88A8A7_FICCA|nr:hypothetical protein TIFTF001_017586 [Ficus carica]